MSNGVRTLICGILVILAIFVVRGYFPAEKTIYTEKIVTVDLSKKRLDSLELAFEVKKKAELAAIVKGNTQKDARMRQMLNEIISLRDSARLLNNSLGEKAELVLKYEGLVGKYRDSLKVVADFLSDSISVVFKPNPREFSVVLRDTIHVPVDRASFIEKAGFFLAGVATASIVHGLSK